MDHNILAQFEQKIENTIEVIELLRLQIEELEEENAALKAEQDKWRQDLAALIQRFEQIDLVKDPVSNEPEQPEFEFVEEELATTA